MPAFRSRLIVPVLLLLASSGLTLGAAEVGVRLLGISPLQGRLEIYQFDATLGWIPRKAHRHFRSTSYFAHFTYYDRAGFPTTAGAWPHPPDPERPSIAFIGDSFVESYYLPYEESVVHRVGQALGKQSLNLGVSGYSPDQYLLYARRHLPRYTVDQIVVMFFAYNDIPYLVQDEFMGYAKPLFSDGPDSASNLPLVPAEPEVRTLLQRAARRSALVALVKPALARLLFPPPGDPFSPVAFSRADLRRAMVFVKRIQAEFPVRDFLVYYVPTEAEIAHPVYDLNVQTYRDVCDELRLRCAALQVEARQPAALSRLFIPGDGHFSAAGARLVADQVIGLLRRTPDAPILSEPRPRIPGGPPASASRPGPAHTER